MDLPENTFELRQHKPTSKDANEDGKVLYFHPTLGWHSSNWSYPLYSGCTHWTYCPPFPPVEKEDPQVLRDKAFEEWLASFDHEFSGTSKELLKLGWAGAWRKWNG